MSTKFQNTETEHELDFTREIEDGDNGATYLVRVGVSVLNTQERTYLTAKYPVRIEKITEHDRKVLYDDEFDVAWTILRDTIDEEDVFTSLYRIWLEHGGRMPRE